MNPETLEEIIKTLDRTIAMYDLLHAHAAGQTCLSEDQLANVVTGVTDEARDTLSLLLRETGHMPPPSRGPWVESAYRRAIVRSPRPYRSEAKH